MKILIIEDEETTARNLKRQLLKYDERNEIIGPIKTVNEAIRWFSNHELPDLILLDIQLGDGISFEIFEELTIKTPIIFTTAYDQYLLKAFELNSIDYLLKPIGEEKLFQSLEKFQSIFPNNPVNSPDINLLIKELNWKPAKYKQRFLVKYGSKMVIIRPSEIAYFYRDDLVYLVTKNNKKYMVSYTLEELNDMLDPKDFFRINRQYIIHSDSIKEMHMIGNKLYLSILTDPKKEVTVSQRIVSEFKNWIDE